MNIQDLKEKMKKINKADLSIKISTITLFLNLGLVIGIIKFNERVSEMILVCK